MVRDSLITDEARAMIGTITGRRTGTVSLKEAQRWAAAVGDRNPIYFDDEAARAAGYRGIVTPPLFLPCVLLGVVHVDELREDGIAAGRRGGIPLKVSRTLHGGEETECFLPVYPGDTITGESRIAAIEEKEGSRGPFVLTTTETVYTNQDGEVVARGRTFGIAR
jgi:acyl dehydratase